MSNLTPLLYGMRASARATVSTSAAAAYADQNALDLNRLETEAPTQKGPEREIFLADLG